ncbi:Hypothetical predicted protein [Octopus vulgaris]|uniref:Uncharacterized protein n=1 Tax=Octopus vulgaris TaxID=6645 RepID=A0AA36FD56_OCTVU|nr:Hypothetical predicted protein [Octopus vulgaris]
MVCGHSMEQSTTTMGTCITQSMMSCFYPAYQTMKQQYHRLRRTSHLQFNKQDFDNMCQVLQTDIVYCMDRIEGSCGQTTRQSALKQLNTSFHYFCYNGWKDYQKFQKCFKSNKNNVQEKIRHCYTTSELNHRNFFEHEYEYINRDFFHNYPNSYNWQGYFEDDPNKQGDGQVHDQGQGYRSDQALQPDAPFSETGTAGLQADATAPAKTETVTSAAKKDGVKNESDDDDDDVNMHEWLRNFGNGFDHNRDYNSDHNRDYWANKYNWHNKNNYYDNNRRNNYDGNDYDGNDYDGNRRHWYDNSYYDNDDNYYNKKYNHDGWQKSHSQRSDLFSNDYYNQNFERLNRETREEPDKEQPQPEAEKLKPDIHGTYEQDKDWENNRNTPFYNNHYRNNYYDRNRFYDQDYDYDGRNYGYNYYNSNERRPDYWAFYNYDVRYRTDICRGMSKMRDCSHEMKKVCNQESDNFMYNLNNMIYQFGRLFMNCDMSAESAEPSPEAEAVAKSETSYCDHRKAISCTQPFQSWFSSFKDNEFKLFSDYDTLRNMCGTMQQKMFPCINREIASCKDNFQYPFETLIQSFTHLCKPEIMEDLTNHHECWSSHSANVTYGLCKELMQSKMEYYYDRHKGDAMRYICGLMSEFQHCVNMIDCEEDARHFMGNFLSETMQPIKEFYQCNESRYKEAGYMKSVSWYDYLPPEMAMNYRNKFN